MEKDIEEDIRFGGQAKSGDLKKNDAGKDQGGVLKSRIFDMSQNKYPLGGINDIVAPLLGSVRGILADNLARHFFMASVDFFFFFFFGGQVPLHIHSKKPFISLQNFYVQRSCISRQFQND